MDSGAKESEPARAIPMIRWSGRSTGVAAAAAGGVADAAVTGAAAATGVADAGGIGAVAVACTVAAVAGSDAVSDAAFHLG